MNKVAIVGLGWLGKPLAAELKKKGFNVCGTTTREEKLDIFLKLEIEALLLNLNIEFDVDKSKSFFKDCTHCIINIPPSKIIFQSYKNKILGLVELFDLQTKFIFISSTSVYSETCEIALENTPILSHYNFTSQLFQTEKALQNKLKSRLTILRLAGLIGKDRNPATFLAGKENLPQGDAPVNIVHLKDCIQFISEIIQQDCWENTFNVCSSAHPSRKEFYTHQCEKLELKIPIFSVEEQPFQNKTVSNITGREILDFNYKFDTFLDF